MTPAEIVQFHEEQQKRDWHLAWWTAALTRTGEKGWPRTPAELWAAKPTAPKTQSLAEMGRAFGMLEARMNFAKGGGDRRTRMQKD